MRIDVAEQVRRRGWQQPRRRPVAQIITPVELSIAETIRSEVREARPDLLIVGTQGRSGIEKFFLGSVAEELLKLSDVDVLAAPAPPKA